MPTVAPRRGSKRPLLLLVLGLVLCTAVLTIGIVGWARSIELVTRAGGASEILREVAQLSPDVTISASATATASGGAPGFAQETAPANAAAAPPPAVTASPPSSASLSGLVENGPAGPDAEVAGAGGAATSGGTASAMGEGGAVSKPSWGSAARTLLTLLARGATQMCGPNTCNVGEVCCNVSCGACVAPGGTCDQRVCSNGPRAPSAVLCGRGQCNDGEVCCNPSCGICAAPGEPCSTQECPGSR